MTDEEIHSILQATPREPGEPEFSYVGRCARNCGSLERQHAFLLKVRELYDPVAFVAEGAQRWRKTNGLPEPKEDPRYIPAPLIKAGHVAHAFDTTPDASHDLNVRSAFNHFKQQNEDMYRFITTPQHQGGLGISVNVVNHPEGEPYSSAIEQAQDVASNRNFNIQTGLGGNHPLMTTPEYDRFRAVHDIFGHVGVGGGFDRHGEYQAWLQHMSMYTPPGANAMASEYHGVNSSVWAGDNSGTGKAILLPSELTVNPWDSKGNLQVESKRAIIKAMSEKTSTPQIIGSGHSPAMQAIFKAHGIAPTGPNGENLHRALAKPKPKKNPWTLK